MLEQAFEALKTYDYGVDRHVLDPIDEAAVTTRNDPAARKDLESRLLAVLQSNAPRDARDYVCRQLRTIGTAASVPALEALLADPDLSHMARYALERIPDSQAGKALERQLRKLNGQLKIGVISSLGTRGRGGQLAATAVAGLRRGRRSRRRHRARPHRLGGREQGPGFSQAPARAGRRVCRCLDVVRREVAGCRPCEGSQSHLPTAAEEQSSRVDPPGRRTRSQSLPDSLNLIA